jgi:hypothetical protein
VPLYRGNGPYVEAQDEDTGEWIVVKRVGRHTAERTAMRMNARQEQGLAESPDTGATTATTEEDDSGDD